MVKTVSQNERDAAAESNPDIKTEDRDTADADTIELEEMAAMYISLGGQDPRALKLFKAAKEAGRIDEDGNWVDEE